MKKALRINKPMDIRVIYVMMLLMLTPVFSVEAQVLRSFSEDHASYLEELESFMRVNISEENELILEQYLESWTMNHLSEEEKNDVIRISNLLLQNRARQNPHFHLYIQIQLVFQKENQDESDYQQWKLGFIQLLEEKSSLSMLQDYLESTLALLQEQLVYNSYSIQWKFVKGDYKILHDKGGTRIELYDVDLKCYSRRDSIVVYHTSGSCDLKTKKWTGTSGTVTWERAGYEYDQVSASLRHYTIDLTRSEYSADSVVFLHKPFRDEQLLGVLEDKVERVSSPENASYPKFLSYEKSFYIKDLYQNIDYSGGFLFSGSRVIGRGEGEERARVIFTRADTMLIKAESNFFVITENRLRGIDTRVALYIGRDSIFHPDLSLTYLPSNRDLTLQRTDQVTSRAAYLNSYHNVLMHFEQLSWMIDEPYIYLIMSRGSAEGNAQFQSLNYFSPGYYESLMGHDERHPLVVIHYLTKKLGRNEFSTEELAQYMNRSISATRHFLLRMASEGFILFDLEEDHAISLPRLDDYLNAFMGKIDYDVMDLNSRVSAPLENAYININTYDMVINGLPHIQLSTAQNVIIYPDNHRVTMKRNRSFQFDGVVNAGLFTFFGSNFFFNYDSFLINLQRVDSLKISTQVGDDNYGRPIYRSIKSNFEDITGELLIDRPDNKSGKEDYPEYPVFFSRQHSYVYYDKSTTMDGTYKKGSFYFQLDPYRIDSLDNFSIEALNFTGTFHAADIIEPIREELKLQDDRSMGFRHQTPSAGYPVYKGKGRFYNELHLSDYGLHGKGKLTYLTSEINSPDFFFYPDSVNSEAVDFEIKRQASGVEYPRVTAKDIYVHWRPYQDFMDIQNRSEAFTIINNQNTLNGKLTLDPKGLKGAGKMDMTTAEMQADEFVYRSNGFSADTADFSLRSLKSAAFTVLTKNVHADIDYGRKKGVFRANEDFTLVEFPENRYISFLDYFEWDMNKHTFSMGTQRNYDNSEMSGFMGDTLVGPRFISVHPKQDSLHFVSTDALYDYEENLLRFEKVQYIRVADAAIFPNEGKVVVEADAKMRKLYQSQVQAAVDNGYYQFHSADIQINGRFSYRGKGKYDYKDENNTVFTIDMHTIGLDDSLTTIAEGAILEQDSFYLSPQFAFQGSVYAHAQTKNLRFKGGAKVVPDCRFIGRHWLLFDAQLKPDSIFIPIDKKPKEINRNPTYAGLMMGNDSVHIYPAWLSGRRNFSDRYVSTASGFLTYDKPSRRYMIGQPEKLLDEALPGDFIYLRQNHCRYFSEGKIDMGIDLWHFDLNIFGDVVYDFDSNSTNLDVLLSLDFFMDEEIHSIMKLHLDTLAQYEGRKDIHDKYVRMLDEYIFQMHPGLTSDAETILFGGDDPEASLIFPQQLDHKLIIRDLQMVWDQKNKAFRSTGEKFTIASAGRMPIDLEVEGFVQVTRRRNGDVFDIFFKLDEHEWYYFGYTRGVLQTISSNLLYNEALMDLPARKRKLKKRRGEKPYIYMISTHEKMQRFLMQFNTRFHEQTRESILDEEEIERMHNQEEEFQEDFLK